MRSPAISALPQVLSLHSKMDRHVAIAEAAERARADDFATLQAQIASEFKTAAEAAAEATAAVGGSLIELVRRESLSPSSYLLSRTPSPPLAALGSRAQPRHGHSLGSSRRASPGWASSEERRAALHAAPWRYIDWPRPSPPRFGTPDFTPRI